MFPISTFSYMDDADLLLLALALPLLTLLDPLAFTDLREPDPESPLTEPLPDITLGIFEELPPALTDLTDPLPDLTLLIDPLPDLMLLTDPLPEALVPLVPVFLVNLRPPPKTASPELPPPETDFTLLRDPDFALLIEPLPDLALFTLVFADFDIKLLTDLTLALFTILGILLLGILEVLALPLLRRRSDPLSLLMDFKDPDPVLALLLLRDLTDFDLMDFTDLGILLLFLELLFVLTVLRRRVMLSSEAPDPLLEDLIDPDPLILLIDFNVLGNLLLFLTLLAFFTFMLFEPLFNNLADFMEPDPLLREVDALLRDRKAIAIDVRNVYLDMMLCY